MESNLRLKTYEPDKIIFFEFCCCFRDFEKKKIYLEGKYMSNKTEAFNNWEEWAKNDWKEFRTFFIAKYTQVHFSEVEKQFAKQMGISQEAMGIFTNIAIGEVISKTSMATIGSILTFAEAICSIGGYAFYIVNRGSIYSRSNPHVPDWDRPWYYSDPLPKYVQYILYCYPRDLDDGYYGFRFGSYKDGSAGTLRRTKKL